MSDKDRLPMSRRQFVLAAPAGVATLMMAPSFKSRASSKRHQPERFQAFDLGWRFHRGQLTGAEAPELDDGHWRKLDLPHDWSIEDLPPAAGKASDIVGPFDKQAAGGRSTGFTVGGEGWYRKRFRIADSRPGRVELFFEGIYMDSDVWLNGHHLALHHNGYTPFFVDLTPYLLINGDNVLAVRVRNLGRNSRWYSGSGIYRHVWLGVWPEHARIAPWGVGVSTRSIENDKADIQIETRLEDVAAGHMLTSRIRDARGETVWEASTPARGLTRQEAGIHGPLLWSAKKPNLYMLETELSHEGTLLDRIETPFGVRVVAFDAKQGMTVNGVPTKLRGGCIHHAHGILGAATFDGAEERKVALLKARGFNAVRPSHNLFSPAFLMACDRQGMMVICETFDAWHEGKLSDDFHIFFEHDWKTDLSSIVLSARNHPSVIMWSIGNEIPGRNDPRGVEIQWRLANEVHRLDPTRPVTAAINGFPGHQVIPSEESARAGTAGVPDRASTVFLDLIGYNYKLSNYEADHVRYPQRIFLGTESFPRDVFSIWDLMEKSPWLIGDFVWTAMDYLGEAGIGGSVDVPQADATSGVASFGAWPWVNSFCGDIDLTGQQKAPSYARDVAWGVSLLEMVVQHPVSEGEVEIPRIWGWPDELQSWSWAGAEGKLLKVRVYTAGDRVELYLNGRRVDARPVTAKDLKKVEFEVPYVPGVLEAVAFHDSREIARRKLETVGRAAAVHVGIEPFGGGAGRGDVHFVAIEMVDAKGRLLPDLAAEVELSVSGAAELIAFGSANPRAVGSFQSARTKTWRGRALAVLRGVGRPGGVVIQANSKGLKAGMVSFDLR